jgi:eukaryotic-like serine/threonine-protein kinase
MRKSYTISISARRLWAVVVPLAVLCLSAGSLLGFFVVDKIIMPTIVRTDRGMVKVPSVVNIPWEQAREKLLKDGLRLRIGVRQYDETFDCDKVINQQPGAGEQVKKGRMVMVTVSKGSEIAAIPEVVGKPERKALFDLRKAGFIIGKVKRDWSDQYEKDAVSKLSPKAGTTISREMPVDVELSNGPKPTHATMPNIIGDGLIDARKKIEGAGLAVGKIDYKHNPTVTPGTVISQSVPPESSVPLESTVNIVVSVTN